MGNRKVIAAKLAQKYSRDMGVVRQGFSVEEQIFIIETLIKIKDIAKERKENFDSEIYEIYDTCFIQKYRKRFQKASNVKILEYFSDSALMYKAVGDDKFDTYTEEEFNELDEQQLTDFERKQLYNFITNYLENTRHSLYMESDPSQENMGNQPVTEKKATRIAKEITIDKEEIKSLYKIVSKYFEVDDHADLFLALQGEVIDKKLLFLDNGNKFIDVFLSLYDKQGVRESKKNINDWICKYFQYRNNKKEVRDFNNEYVHKILTGQSFVKNKIEFDLDK